MLDQVYFFEQLQLSQQQIRHQIILKFLLLTRFQRYFILQDLNTRFFNFDQLFKPHRSLPHFTLDLVLNDFI